MQTYQINLTPFILSWFSKLSNCTIKPIFGFTERDWRSFLSVFIKLQWLFIMRAAVKILADLLKPTRQLTAISPPLIKNYSSLHKNEEYEYYCYCWDRYMELWYQICTTTPAHFYTKLWGKPISTIFCTRIGARFNWPTKNWEYNLDL